MRNKLSPIKWGLVPICCFALAASPSLGAEVVKSSGGDCSVRVLESANDDDTKGGDRGNAYLGKVLTPGTFQKLAVRAALDRMPPLLCHALEQIVFVGADIRGESGAQATILGIVYSDQPDTVYMSANLPEKAAEETIRLDLQLPNGKLANGAKFAKVVRRILHEAAHTAENLLESQTDDGGGEAWARAARELASTVIENMRLKEGFEDEWERLHESFIENSCSELGSSHWVCSLGGDGLSFAGDYDSDLAREIGQEADSSAHAAGFSTAYGARNESEDLAEVVAAPLAWDLYEEAGVNIGGYTILPGRRFDACWRLEQEAGPGVPSSVAALFTKLAFARDVGFITREDFDDCVAKVRHQHKGQGYFSYKDNKPSKEYTDKVEGHIGLSDPITFFPLADVSVDLDYSFHFQAEGPTYKGSTPVTGQVRLKLHVAQRSEGLDAASWPRGLYLIDTESGFGGNQFWFMVPEDPTGMFYATRAIVLVTGSSHEIIEGSVFVVAGWRPLAPPPVPQGGLPAKATFRAVKPGVTEEGASD